MRKQSVLNKPKREIIGSYITNKGIRLLNEGVDPKEVNAKYLKNRYATNKDVKVVRVVKHVN